MWTLHRQQQQRGAQMHARANRERLAGEPPADAVAGREAQEHGHAALVAAGEQPRPGEGPASALGNRGQDITPSAPVPQVTWDEVVQPERDEEPLPEGK